MKLYRGAGTCSWTAASEIEDAVEAVQELVNQTKRQPQRLSRVVTSRADIDQPGECAGPEKLLGDRVLALRATPARTERDGYSRDHEQAIADRAHS